MLMKPRQVFFLSKEVGEEKGNWGKVSVLGEAWCELRMATVHVTQVGSLKFSKIRKKNLKSDFWKGHSILG